MRRNVEKNALNAEPRKLSSREKIPTYVSPSRLPAFVPISNPENARVRIKKTDDNPNDDERNTQRCVLS